MRDDGVRSLYLPNVDFSQDLARNALLALALIIIEAKIGGELLGRISQPPVLGELIVGILLGNLGLVGITALEALRSNALLDVVAQIGAVLLLLVIRVLNGNGILPKRRWGRRW